MDQKSEPFDQNKEPDEFTVDGIRPKKLSCHMRIRTCPGLSTYDKDSQRVVTIS